MSILTDKLDKASTVAIMGHIHPDGDCVGSSLGLYNYINKVYPQKKVTVLLEKPSEKFKYMNGFDDIVSILDKTISYDLVVCLDSSDRERLGDFGVLLDTSRDAICIDHHITNTHYIKDTVLKLDASSTCENLYTLLEESKIDKDIAECIYTGIIHDTGVFKYTSTTEQTMIIAGKLMSYGIDFTDIIDGSFYRKSYLQNQVLGKALLESISFMEGKCIFSVLHRRDMDFFNVTGKDLDGIIDQLRNTEGVECAVFLYETGFSQFKVSMRSQKIVNVSTIASFFGGGGHIRAAGCTMNGNSYDIINNLSELIIRQLNPESL